MNIVFVKFGTKYSSYDVNRLAAHYDSVYCYTDDPDGLDTNVTPIVADKGNVLFGVWNKLKLFDRNFPLKGKTLYLDLDTVLRRPPEINVDWSQLTVMHSHWKPQSMINPFNYDVTICSQIMAWDANNNYVHAIWDRFLTNVDYFTRKYQGIDRFIHHEGFGVDHFDRDLIQSWKYEAHKPNASVITFEEIDFGQLDLSEVQ